MVKNSKNPIRMITGVILHRHLLLQLVKRDIEARYKGSVIGVLWSLFHPVVMLAIYTFVFSFVFQARWTSGSDDKTEFALVLFIGMIAHSLLAENISRAPTLIVSNTNYVKKVVFPLEILPWSALGTTLFHSFISLLVWASFYFIVNLSFHWTALFLPLVVAPLILYSIGFSLMFAAMGVFIRDIGQITGILATILLFLSPIFYPVSNIPEAYQMYMYINPLTVIVEQAREVLLWGHIPNWKHLGFSYISSLIIAATGFYVFQKTRPGFADVL
jgi:lipopolysaccharide transport system permease protein